MFRAFAAVIAVAVAAAPLVADDKKDEKVDAAKLVGKWKLTKSKSFPPGATAVVEFTKTGELKLAMTIEKIMPPGEARYVRIPRELEAKAYVWPEYAKGAEAEGGEGAAPKFGSWTIRNGRSGPNWRRQSPIMSVSKAW